MATEVYSTANNDRRADVRIVPLESIAATPLNPRKRFDEGELREMAESIAEHGILLPILVRDHPDLGETLADGSFRVVRYQIVDGERRWRAAKLAGVDVVPVRYLGRVEDKRLLELALVANLQRTDLDPIEEAEGFRTLHDDIGLTQTQIAGRVNRSQEVIANRLRLLKLDPDVQARVRTGELTASDGIALAKYAKFPAAVAYLAEQAKYGLTSKQIETFFSTHQTYQLRGQNWFRDVDHYGARFDTKVCQQCPFGARFGDFCLQPEHYDELQAAAEAERDAEKERAIAAMADRDAVFDLRVNRFPDDWTFAGDAIPGCSEDCPCSRQGISAAGTPSRLCVDQPRHQKLADARRKAEEAEKSRKKREAKKGDLELVRTMLERVDTADNGAVMTVLAYQTLHGLDKDGIKAAMKAWAPTLADVDWSGYRFPLEDLAKAAPLALARALVEASLRYEIKRGYDNSWPAAMPLMNLLFGANRHESPATIPPNPSGSAEAADEPPAICRRCGVPADEILGEGGSMIDVDLCYDCQADIDDGAPEELTQEEEVAVRALGVGRNDPDTGKCRVCGCTQEDCRACIERTGEACHWVERNLCSACDDDAAETLAGGA